MDIDELRSAYDRFLAAAAAVGPDPGRDDGGWTVAHVVAHVSANDELIAAFVRAAIAGTDPDYDNDPVWRTAPVEEYLKAAGGWSPLLIRARANADAVLEIVAGVDDATAATPFDVRIVDGGTERVNGPVPLAGFIGAQTGVHLPAHTAQIEALAPSTSSPSRRS
jgi:hypothetical protein